MTNELLAASPLTTDFRPRSFQEALQFCEFISKSELVPTTYRGKPADIFTAIQAGAELGFSPMQSLQSLIVIQGRPSMYSDAMLALVQASEKMEWIKEWAQGDVAYCETKRVGYPESYKVAFSQADAERMGLAKKPGAWTQTPGRMRQHRARAFNLRDQYADVLRGMGITEELDDVETAKHAAQVQLSVEKGDMVLAKIEARAEPTPKEDGAGQSATVSESATSRDAPAPSHRQADLEIVLKDLLREASQFKTVEEGNQVLMRAAEIEGVSVHNMQLLNRTVAGRMKVLKSQQS